MILPNLAPCLGHLCQRHFGWVGSTQVQSSAPACKVTLLLSVSPHQHLLVDVALHRMCEAEPKSAFCKHMSTANLHQNYPKWHTESTH